MKLERSKNTLRNVRINLISTTVGLLCPFLMRTAFIRTLGTEYLGLNSLFTSVLSILSLAELGFGSAIAFCLYGAISRDDDRLICALLGYFRHIYRVVGSVVLGVGLILIPFLPKLVNGTYPQNINPVVVYLIFLSNTALSYFLYAYMNTFINAFQRNDITNLIRMVMNLIMYSLQVAVLLFFPNYYCYILLIPVFTLLTNVETAVVAKKMFPKYKPFGKIDLSTQKEINEKVKGLLIQKVCHVSRNSFDSIFVSMFLGLSQIAIYNNYYYIMNAVVGVISTLTNAMLAGVGNSVASETISKNASDMKKLDFGYMWLSAWCTSCLLCLYQPFMRIWMGAENLLPISSVVLFSLYFYVLKMGDIRSLYADASGIWWHTRHRALLEAIANILLNYFLGKKYGVNGIIAATLISLFLINFCYGSTLVFKYYFGKQYFADYFKFQMRMLLVSGIVCACTFGVCSSISESALGFFIRLPICAIFPNIVLYLIYRNTQIFKESVPWIAKRTGLDRLVTTVVGLGRKKG